MAKTAISLEEHEMERVSSLVSMAQWQKKRFTEMAQKHGLSLSAFFRLAAEEYIEHHQWEGEEAK